jgi:hypothetical protein
MLARHTVEQSSTVTNLYYDQVMNNLAQHAANPESLPSFSYANTGQNAVQRTASVNYQLSWDLITAAGRLFDRYLLDKQSSTITGTNQNNETWNTVTTYDPDKLRLMQYAYDKAFGRINAKNDKVLSDVLGNTGCEVTAMPATDPKEKGTYAVKSFPRDYYCLVYPGWFMVGSRHDVPKDACYVGHCGKTYVWVMPDHVVDLSNFTLAILDIATLAQVSGAGQPTVRQQPLGSYGPGILPPPPAP